MKNICLFFAGCIASILVYLCCIEDHAEAPGGNVDTITIVDTIPFYYPVPKDSVVVRYVAEKLPVVSEGVPKIADSVPQIAVSVPKDSVSVQIPIVQKVYENSTYKAYVSGFRPNLDSLIVYPTRQVVTIVPPKEKPHRWHIGPSIGVGMTTNGIQPTLGITLTYSIWSW